MDLYATNKIFGAFSPAEKDAGGVTPPVETYLYELEDGTGFIELEDGTGYLQLEEAP